MNRAYAIGDIHGQFDRLREAHARVAADRRACGDDAAPVIHLGDLVDRGPHSAQVIDYLMAGPARGGPWIALFGNHDRMFLRWLDDPEAPEPGLNPAYDWLHEKLGGRDTLASYGVTGTEGLHARAIAAVPAAHRAWLAARPRLWRLPGLAFVHAGVRPGVPLERQVEQDLVWIRRDFLPDPRDHGALIIHGHTPVETPEHAGNRVNLDTGAGYGRALTAAVIEDGQIFVLTDAGRLPLPPP